MIEPLRVMTDNSLFGMAATLAAYSLAASLHRALGGPTLLHPVLVASGLVVLVLFVTELPYETYFAQSYALHAALGVLVVLLAVPLHRKAPLILKARGMLIMALPLGASVALGGALLIPTLTDAPWQVLATVAPKSVTTAVAIQISEGLGGLPSLTALVVVSTGIFGAMFGPGILRLVGIRDHRAIGLALGVSAHVIGTARAFQISEVAGAFSTLGMILNALLSVVLIPIVLLAL